MNTKHKSEELLAEINKLKEEIVSLKTFSKNIITERNRTDLEKQVIYDITYGVNTTANLDELLKIIHESLSKVVYAENCFVALHDSNTGLFHFPFFVDKYDSIPEPVTMHHSCTAYIFKSGEPLLLTQELFDDLAERKEVSLVGTNSPSWIGIPLPTPTGTIGVLVLQHYEKEQVYSEQDVKFLTSVGSQIAAAIQRKRSEDELRESENIFRRVFDESADPILLLDNTGFTNCNAAPFSFLGYSSKKELLDKKPWELSPEKQPDGQLSSAKVELMVNKAIEEGYNRFEWIHKKKDGTDLPVEVMLTPIELKGKQIIYTVWRDITDRMYAEEKLREERLLLRTVIDNLPASIYCKDVDGRKTLANRAELKMMGANSEDEVLGKTDFDFYPKELAEGFFAYDQSVIKNMEPVINREEYLVDSNGEKKWILTSKIPMVDDNGSIIGLVGIGRDVTERVKITKEIEERNEQLTKLNAEKDKFFSIIAHDLKSPFTGLLGLTELMVDCSDSFTTDEFVEYSKSINKASQKLYKLLENLLEWAQVQRGTITFTPMNLDLAQIVSQSIDTIYQRALQKQITIINEITTSQEVFTDEKMTETVLRNLLSNAVKFTKSGGKVIVKAESADDNTIRVSVEDTGVGIQQKDIDRLFKIEEKVSSEGTEGESSTGLGLLLCKEFVEMHGGKIWVESENGKGSKFSFTIHKANA